MKQYRKTYRAFANYENGIVIEFHGWTRKARNEKMLSLGLPSQWVEITRKIKRG